MVLEADLSYFDDRLRYTRCTGGVGPTICKFATGVDIDGYGR